MTGLRAWVCWGFAAVSFVILSQPVLGERDTGRSPTTELLPANTVGGEGSKAEHVPPGNPIIGLLIIGGAVAFLIFVAWVFSRLGEGGSRPTDNTLN